ncbi:MAG: DUF1631 domain-containing protein [Chromatiaceae bacterium]|jgi:hypothetical protein|nr:DUF1631 domain-containing protein [Chromatiaceae bacterium]
MDTAITSDSNHFAQPRLNRSLRSTESRTEGTGSAPATLEAAKQSSDIETANEIVSRLLGAQIVEHPLPPIVARFITTHCRFYLIDLYFAEGDHGQNWRNALEETEKLIWSLQPKQDKDDRKRLFALLPDLFQWVHTVLKSQRLTATDEDAFFAELARLHAVALRPQEQSIGASRSSEVIDFSASAKPIETQNDSAATNDSVTQREALLPQKSRKDEPPKIDNGGSDQLSNLRIGSWVEFSNERSTTRVMRLKWISGQKSALLFADHHTEGELFVTAKRLNERLLEGSARVLK